MRNAKNTYNPNRNRTHRPQGATGIKPARNTRNQTNGRITGIKNAELINNLTELDEVKESMIKDWTRWVFADSLKWREHGFAIKADSIYVPSARNSSRGEIVASVGDYVLNFNDGRKAIVFTPEMKERIARNDFSWVTG